MYFTTRRGKDDGDALRERRVLSEGQTTLIQCSKRRNTTGSAGLWVWVDIPSLRSWAEELAEEPARQRKSRPTEAPRS